MLGMVEQSDDPIASDYKAAKPRVWKYFDDYFSHPRNAQGPICVVNHALDAIYRQRAAWNGLRKFAQCVDILQSIVHAAEDAVSAEDFVADIVRAEPASFRIVGTSISLLESGVLTMSRTDSVSQSLDAAHAHKQPGLFA